MGDIINRLSTRLVCQSSKHSLKGAVAAVATEKAAEFVI
jgi:hypothetical protein